MIPPKRNLALACNSAAERCLAIGLASNVASILGAEEWQPLADYGTTDYWRDENGVWKKYSQVFCAARRKKWCSR